MSFTTAQQKVRLTSLNLLATLYYAAWDAVGSLCHKGTLLACGHLVPQDPQVIFCKAALQLASPQHVLVQGLIPPQGQDVAQLHKHVGLFL